MRRNRDHTAAMQLSHAARLFTADKLPATTHDSAWPPVLTGHFTGIIPDVARFAFHFEVPTAVGFANRGPVAAAAAGVIALEFLTSLHAPVQGAISAHVRLAHCNVENGLSVARL